MELLKIGSLNTKRMPVSLGQRCEMISYPFGVSEGIWDLGEGEFTSSVNLGRENKPVMLH